MSLGKDFFPHLSAPYVLSFSALAWYFMHNVLWKEYALCWSMLIFVCQFGQCRRREEQKDVRVSFHIEHWYVFLSFWLLAWTCKPCISRVPCSFLLVWLEMQHSDQTCLCCYFLSAWNYNSALLQLLLMQSEDPKFKLWKKSCALVLLQFL